VSEKFWICWVTAIPAAAVVMILGLAWLRIFARRFLPMWSNAGELGKFNATVECKVVGTDGSASILKQENKAQ
jgi:hypothetical protein